MSRLLKRGAYVCPVARAMAVWAMLSAVLCSLSWAQVPDRIAGAIDSTQKVTLNGNMHGLARPQSDLGRADGSRRIDGISLNFHLSAAQQKDMDEFLVQLADRSSPNYHKYLTIPQYADRFGMSQSDLDKVVAWVQSQGFTNIKIARSHNKISFDGTVAQIEAAFGLEMHNYLVDGVVHLANAMNPSVPAALSGVVQYVGHLHDFAPKPRAVRPHLTSYVSGNHFLSPGDFATIYNVNPLYTAGATGSNQKIAIVGQSTVSTSDLSNFRNAAGLTASTVTMDLMEGTATRCSGDEGESDLDLEWSGGVAKDASITFVYAGLGSGDTCIKRFDTVWDALEEALTGSLTQGSTGTPIAPFVSTSYGYCESGLGAAFAGPYTGTNGVGVLEQWIQEGQTLGVTLVAASGDAGAADCDATNSTSATHGLAVDSPAAIPETTGAGGTEFNGDTAGTVSGNQAGADEPYWGASGAGSDVVVTALEYIPELGWNDTDYNLANGGGIGASGGGASIYFTKPSWQTGTGVPADGKRDVPDIALNASPDHDGYLFCSEDDGSGGIVSSCTSGFRTGAGGNFTVVGGTSAVAPTFSAILALVNQYVGNVPPAGLAPINPDLYAFAAGGASPFHDIQAGSNSITSGNNIVPCTDGTTGCPTSAPFQYGFDAGVGYDQVTGLGSVDANALGQSFLALVDTFTVSAGALGSSSLAAGTSTTATITVTPQNNFSGTVTFSCPSVPSGVTCTFNPTSVTGGNGTTTLTITTAPTMAATASVSVTVQGASGSATQTTSVSFAVTATTESFTVTTNPTVGTLTVAQGGTTSAVNLVVTSTSTPSFIVTGGTTAVPVTYSCVPSSLPSESTCYFSPSSTSSQTTVTMTIKTTAPTAKLETPFGRGSRIFYALALPGLFGVVLMFGMRKRSLGTLRVLGLIAVLGISTAWMASCGGSSGGGGGSGNSGTPVGSYTVTVNAATGGAVPLTSSFQFTLTVSAAAK